MVLQLVHNRYLVLLCSLLGECMMGHEDYGWRNWKCRGTNLNKQDCVNHNNSLRQAIRWHITDYSIKQGVQESGLPSGWIVFQSHMKRNQFESQTQAGYRNLRIHIFIQSLHENDSIYLEINHGRSHLHYFEVTLRNNPLSQLH